MQEMIRNEVITLNTGETHLLVSYAGNKVRIIKNRSEQIPDLIGKEGTFAGSDGSFQFLPGQLIPMADAMFLFNDCAE